MNIPSDIKEKIDIQFEKFEYLINKYSKFLTYDKEYNYFDGYFMSISFKNDINNAFLEILLYKNQIELNYYKNLDFVEISDGRKSCKSIQGKREYFLGEITEEQIKEAFNWLHNEN